MPRAVWALILTLSLALMIPSCASQKVDCPTCPPENSSALIFLMTPTDFSKTVDQDSLHVRLDGGASVTFRRGTNGRISDLAAGTHTVSTTIYRSDENHTVSTSAVSFEVVLARGEKRTIYFHHDLPVVVFAPSRADGTVIAARPQALLRAG
jgi:hypothetical protein